MKLQVSADCYNEVAQALKRIGREINDGTVISLEKGDAIVPPFDFRMVAIRQNCLMAISEIFKINEGDFLKTAQEIFNWCLIGEIATNSNPNTKDT